MLEITSRKFEVLRILTLFSFLLLIRETRPQLKSISLIKHTFVGNTIVTHCNRNTVNEKRENFTKVEIHLKTSPNSDVLIYEATNRQIKKPLPLGDNYLISTAGFPNHQRVFEVTLVIVEAEVSHEGLYYCKAQKSNGRWSQGSMVHLFVHETRDNNPCQNNWLHYRETDTCIRSIPETMNWHMARNFCQHHHNGDLIKMKSNDMEFFVTTTTGLDKPFWIGLRSPDGKTDYFWLSESQGQLPHTYWAILQPKYSKKEYCAAKDGQGRGMWRSINCTTDYSVICERSKAAVSIWRPPPLWKTITATLVVFFMILGVSCLFFDLKPDRAGIAKMFELAGRSDIDPRPPKRNIVIVLYDSELDALMTD